MSDEKHEPMNEDTSDEKEMEGFRLTKDNFPKVQLTLVYFIQLLTTHAYIYLGLIPIPGSEETIFDLGEAKQAIDILALMVDKAKENLDEAEKRELDNTISQLRMNYASKAEKEKS